MAEVKAGHNDAQSRYEARIEGKLPRLALDEVRTASTRRVLPVSPFIKAWVGRHREYADLRYAAPASSAREAGRPR